jgi:hypothetical protein
MLVEIKSLLLSTELRDFEKEVNQKTKLNKVRFRASKSSEVPNINRLT